ncbi:sodium:proton antiporter, partial [Vibrio vulnificus]
MSKISPDNNGEWSMGIYQRIVVLITLLFPTLAFGATTSKLNLTTSAVGILCLFIFVLSYILVMLEEYLKMRKSKPVLLAAGLIWILIGFSYQSHG